MLETNFLIRDQFRN